MFAFQPANAESENSLFSMSLEQLLSVKVSTASKRSQDVNIAPSIISVFTKNEISKMGVVSLIDVIKHAPGVETSMAPDGQWRVSIRGARKDGIILFLIDGKSFNDAYDGQAQFDLPLALVEKIEIIRGPGSALYGTNAVAGIINVFTHKTEPSANLGLGNHNSRRVAFNNLHKVSQGEISYNLGFNSSDGANQVEGSDINQIINANNNQNLKTNRHIEEYFLSTSLKNKDYEVSFFSLNKKRGPWVGSSINYGPETTVDKSQYFLKGIYHFKIYEKLMIKPQIHLNKSDFESLNQDILDGRVLLGNEFVYGGFTREKYRTSDLGTEIQLEYELNESSYFLGGISYQNIKMDDYDLQRNYEVIGFIPHNDFSNHDQLIFQQFDKDRQVSAIYAQSETNWLDFSFTLGFRYDDYSDFGSSFNPRLGFVYKINSEWSTKLLYGTAFRAPTFKELYDNTRIGPQGFSGNNELEPEENVTIEFGLEYQTESYALRGNLFDIDATNLIELFDPDGSGSRGSIQNVGNLRTKGFETEFIYEINSGLRIFANYSRYKMIFNWNQEDFFLESQNYLNERGNKQLFNQPRTRSNIGLDWSYNKWSLFLSANYGGRASHNNTLALEGLRDLVIKEYVQYNFSVDYKFSPNLNLRLLANNLGNDKNSDPNGSSESDSLGIDGLLQPDKSFMLELNYQF